MYINEIIKYLASFKARFQSGEIIKDNNILSVRFKKIAQKSEIRS